MLGVGRDPGGEGSQGADYPPAARKAPASFQRGFLRFSASSFPTL